MNGETSVSAIRKLLVVVACALGLLGVLAADSPQAWAQPSPQPQECVCSVGINIGTEKAPVIIKHCHCGAIACAVVVGSGQLQCVRQ